MPPRPTEAQELLERLRGLAAERPSFAPALALILAHFRAESGTVHELAGGQLELRAHTPGMPPPVLAVIQRIPLGKGMAGLAVERGEPVTACNLQTDTSGDVRPGARATGLRGSIVVPMIGAHGVNGALGIGNREERVFTPAEVELLLAAARILASWAQA